MVPVTCMMGFPFSVKSLWKCPLAHTQRCVFYVIPNLVQLMIKMTHCKLQLMEFTQLVAERIMTLYQRHKHPATQG